MIRFFLAPALALILGACAAAPKIYLAPDSSKLRAAAGKLSSEVDAAHASARKAQTAVSVARKRQAEIAAEVKKIKDVPKALVDKIEEQDATLDDASSNQADLETHLSEADKAKAQAAALSPAYFAKVDSLATQATDERTARVKADKSLSWYRWHWWGSWIVLGLGIAACVLLAILKVAGKLAL